jgi:hypothetical protein
MPPRRSRIRGWTVATKHKENPAASQGRSQGNEVMLDDVPEVVIQMRKPMATRRDLVTLKAA